MDVKNLFETLADTKVDPAVGIQVARLSGGEDFSLFGAAIRPGTKLSAHFHREGLELYYILDGAGRVSLGRPASDQGVEWTEHFDVRAGDCFTVQPGQVHQLHNTGELAMSALFGCPTSHLTTDRTVLP